MVVFFGDHQPNVTSSFYDALLDSEGYLDAYGRQQAKMVTPFFIWANYDIEEAQDVQISTNYLAAYALDVLGCQTSGYDQLRLALREQVPLINRYGYRTADGIWHDTEAVEEQPLLADYEYLQYARLFDVKRRPDAWYEP